ncbi:LuxR C-terminal-related transcriptional regulator [Microvirga guangxiensis]|uniref:Two component transcriptional regulator, LuxR family n=1 Tax=Microvirga guangxiensis TaxID=549386 RepID=A0A1G5KXL6_9HYPH|nr:response regulator transcription factor [Microvirga guangxiensis]SCZ05352.1 two component transcriptional regulator, LuxR family [Microvirga guangxiensis]
MDEIVRVGIVDRHPLFRDGIILALNSQPDLNIVGQGISAREAVRICHESQPDVMIIDADALGQDKEAVEAILQQDPEIGIVILADEADEERVHEALRWGVRGYLLKGTSRMELIQTVRVLSQGQSFISPSLAAKLFMRAGNAGMTATITKDRLPRLTPREQQILSILVQGRSNKEIGNSLHLSEKTIKHHLTNILQKLRVRNRVEAAIMASSNLPPQVTVLEARSQPQIDPSCDPLASAGNDTLLLRLA